jgi:hypothetical protein
MDFDTLVMTSTSSHLGDRETRVKEALKLDVTPLGRRLKGADVQRNNIVLSENFWDPLELKLKDKFSDLDVVRLNANEPVQIVMEMVASARLLVGDYTTILIHMLLDEQGRRLRRLRDPPDLACNTLARKFTGKVGVKYVKVNKAENC